MTQWIPAYRVTLDGANITNAVQARLNSIRLVDRAGIESDTVEIDLTDTLPHRLAMPNIGGEISISLGYAFDLKPMGLFITDSVEVGGMPQFMRVRGTAAIQGETTSGKSAMTAQETRSWPEGTTAGDLVTTIATEHGLEPVVAASIRDLELHHIDQVDESPINLLTRVAQDLGALVKPAGGSLVMVSRGESLGRSGQPMPRIAIRRDQMTSWNMTTSQREVAGSVIAVWRDRDASSDVEVRVGDQQPVRRLRPRFPSRQAAAAAAQAELSRGDRAAKRLTLSMPGNADVVAEARMVLSGVREGVDGEWLVVTATHTVSSGSGYTTSVVAETV